MLLWPLDDVADAHDWLAVLGLVVIVRMIAIFLGISAVLSLWRNDR